MAVARRAVISGTGRAMPADVRHRNPVADPLPFPRAGALDLPGRPVPVLTPGHTRGHSAYHLRHAGAVVTGDALVSGHPTSRVRGPQLLPVMFDHERARAVHSLDVLAGLDGDLLLPGHGPAHRGPVRAAARLARERAL
nr:MBL fold metallo-hydrolase [Streptomyces cyaneogriseus]